MIMKSHKAVAVILCVVVAAGLLSFLGCAMLFRIDSGLSALYQKIYLIGPPSSPLAAGITAERSVMQTDNTFSAQVFFGAYAGEGNCDYFEIAVDAADFAVSMDVPQVLSIGEDGLDWEQFHISNIVKEAENLPFSFQLSLTPVWNDGNKKGMVEIEISMLTEDNRGRATRSIILYYCGSEKNVCFSPRSPEHARWLLWRHDL